MRAVFSLLLGLSASLGLAANELHPSFPLLDQSGQLVVQSGMPLSGVVTCGECHDTAFIVESSDHAAAGVFGNTPGLNPAANYPSGLKTAHRAGDHWRANVGGLTLTSINGGML